MPHAPWPPTVVDEVDEAAPVLGHHDAGPARDGGTNSFRGSLRPKRQIGCDLGHPSAAGKGDDAEGAGGEQS